jgi:hypothetical protein
MYSRITRWASRLVAGQGDVASIANKHKLKPVPVVEEKVRLVLDALPFGAFCPASEAEPGIIRG